MQTDGEAMSIARSTHNPVKAAVRLRDVAIGRGSKDNISVLVVQLNALSQARPDAGDDVADTVASEPLGDVRVQRDSRNPPLPVFNN